MGSGVYQYFDINGRLLYIGKAKSLKNRVKSYFKFFPSLLPADKLSARISKMISEVANLEYIVVPSEHDALILENSLIKQLAPKYNILLRDDKTFPYIYIDLSQDFPRFEITRKVIKGKSIKYFGPFSVGANEIISGIYETIPLVQKKSCISGKKACMFYQIKKCLAPCEQKITIEEYRQLVNLGIELISNKSKLINLLDEKMSFLAENLRFEEAKELRDSIDKIKRSRLNTGIDFAKLEDLDVIAVKQSGFKIIIVQMFIRNGRLISSNHSLIKSDDECDLNEVYDRTIVNYYKEKLPTLPNQIIVGQALENVNSLEEFISQNCHTKITINTPKIGKKREILDIAFKNCDELLRLSNISHNDTLGIQLKELFSFDNIPFRIEIFDNSHLMGQAKVGAMVVWEDKFVSKDYRHYNLEARDEYHQMDELLKRRVNSFDTNPPPDLWIIDGGKTLLDLAKNIIQSSGANIDCIAISKEKKDAKTQRAKSKANDILYGYKDVFKLEPSDRRLQFVQRLRDEAHRFAITFHKKQKQAQDKQISLLSIKGFGEAKIKKLLQYFGTFENIKNASLDELKVVINEKDATLLINFLKN